MNILYTINDKYLDIMLASLYSIIENSNLDTINLHIVTENFTKSDYLKLKEFTSKFSSIQELHTYNFEDKLIEEYKIPKWRGSGIANARLFYPRIIKEKDNSIKNLLYLDSDTIIVDDLNGFKLHNDNLLSAVIDTSANRSYIERFLLDKYYNSGVLYFNLDKWEEYDIEKRIKYFQENNNYNICYPDQDILNITMNGEISTLKPNYNMTPYPYLLNNLYLKLYYNKKYKLYSYEDIVQYKDNPIILHSCGLFNIKPWSNNNINPFNEVFSTYIEKVENNYTKEELTTIKKLITINPTLFKSLIILKTYLPSSLQEKGNKLSLKLQKSSNLKRNL